jgi:hypothetical protein
MSISDNELTALRELSYAHRRADALHSHRATSRQRWRRRLLLWLALAAAGTALFFFAASDLRG